LPWQRSRQFVVIVLLAFRSADGVAVAVAVAVSVAVAHFGRSLRAAVGHLALALAVFVYRTADRVALRVALGQLSGI